MFCRNCGNQMDPQAVGCVHCGVGTGAGNTYCPNCGANTPPGAAVCTSCGIALPQMINPELQKSKLAAGLLGIFLGGIGVHNFYLGFTGKGVAQIIVSVVTCGIGGIWGFIEGILLLTGNINRDANGLPLKD